MEGLKYIREKIMNLTMEEMAEMLDVSKQMIYLWEKGKKLLPEKRLEQLEKLTGIPKRFFAIEELTEKDKLDIKNHYLGKQIDETSSGYDMQIKYKKEDTEKDNSLLIDPRRVRNILLQKIHLEIMEVSGKIEAAIWQCEIENRRSVRKCNLSDEELYMIDKRNQFFNRFADVVINCKRQDVLESMLKAMELFFFEKNDNIDEEDTLVEDIVKVLEHYKNKKLELLKKELEETKKKIEILES